MGKALAKILSIASSTKLEGGRRQRIDETHSNHAEALKVASPSPKKCPKIEETSSEIGNKKSKKAQQTKPRKCFHYVLLLFEMFLSTISLTVVQ